MLLFFRVCLLISAFALVQCIYEGNKFNIKRIPYIIYGHCFINYKYVYAGTILSKTMFLSSRDVGGDPCKKHVIISGVSNPLKSSQGKRHTLDRTKMRRDYGLGVYTVVEPFEFGPRVQKAVLPRQDYTVYPFNKMFYIAGWCTIEPVFDTRLPLPEDLLARPAFITNYPTIKMEYDDPREIFYLSDNKNTSLPSQDCGSPVFDIRTGEVVAITLYTEKIEDGVQFLLVVGTAGHREKIDQWMKELK